MVFFKFLFCPGTDISTEVQPMDVKFCMMVDMDRSAPLLGAPQRAPKSRLLTANISKTVSRAVTCQIGRNIGSTGAYKNV